MPLRARLPDAAQGDPLIGQALVGIVGPQGQAILRPRGEHPVRLGDPAGHEIIDHHAEIAVRAIEHDRVGTAGRQSRVQARDNSLRRRLLISGRAVDLSGQEETRQALGLQRRLEFARIDMVVFDGIARPDHLHPLESGNGREDRELNLFRQRGRDAVGIDRGVVEPFRLQEDLVAVAVAEPDDLVLDRGTIARTAALDLTGIHRRAMHVGPDHFMGRRRRPGDPALDLRRRDPVGHDRERLRRVIAGLHFNGGPVDSRAIEPRRRAGLQSSERKANPFEGSRKPHRRRLADPAGRPVLFAEMDQTPQKSPGGDDHGTGGELTAVVQAECRSPGRSRRSAHPPRLRSR